MASSRIKVYVKKQIRVDGFNIQQRQMLQLGNVGLASRKDEISRGRNAQGGPAKPLSKRYAIRKSFLTKLGQGRGRNIRDLYLTGSMMREWSVRTVSNTEARAGFTTRKNRVKAQENNAIEEFISWSPENTRKVVEAGNRVVKENTPRMILEKALNG